MGTRADFYVGRGPDADWLGSIAWDGYPAGIDNSVLLADTETEYRVNVAAFLEREDGTIPEEGWPWPWDDSGTTDYAYGFDGGVVYGSSFGDAWFEVKPLEENGGEPEDNEGPAAVFPNMAEVRNMPPLGSKASGTIVISGPTA